MTGAGHSLSQGGAGLLRFQRGRARRVRDWAWVVEWAEHDLGICCENSQWLRVSTLRHSGHTQDLLAQSVHLCHAAFLVVVIVLTWRG